MDLKPKNKTMNKLSARSKLTLPTVEDCSMKDVLQNLKNTLQQEKVAKEIAEGKLKTRGALTAEQVENYKRSLDLSISRIAQYERAIYLIELDMENPVISPADEEEHF